MPKEYLREQLEEFAIHIKPGTTKGKHRIATFDTVVLTELVQEMLIRAGTDGYKKGYIDGQLATGAL